MHLHVIRAGEHVDDRLGHVADLEHLELRVGLAGLFGRLEVVGREAGLDDSRGRSRRCGSGRPPPAVPSGGSRSAPARHAWWRRRGPPRPGTRWPAIEPMWMIWPRPPRARMSARASRVQMQRPSTLTSSISRHCSTSPSARRPAWPRPALLTSTSTPPNRSRAAANAALTAASSRTSQARASDDSPAGSAAARTSATAGCRRPQPTTRRPSASSRLAIAAPIPLLAPVTSAVFPAQRAMPCVVEGCMLGSIPHACSLRTRLP